MKKASEFGIPSTELVFFRASFQALCVILCMFHFRDNRKHSKTLLLSRQDSYTLRQGEGQGEQDCQVPMKGDLLIRVPFGRTQEEKTVVILRGLAGGAFGLICHFYAMKTIPLGDAVTLKSMNPIYTIFAAKFFLNEEIRCRNLILALACSIGGILIAGPSFLSEKNEQFKDYNERYNPLGYTAAIIGSLFAPSVFILMRKAGKMGVHTLQLLLSWSLCGLTASLICGRTLGRLVEGRWGLPEYPEAWFYILGLCITGTSAHILFDYSGRIAPAGLSSMIRSTEVLWAYMIELVVFCEVPSVTTVVGVVLILGSLTMVAVDKFHHETEKKVDSSLEVGSSAPRPLLLA